MEKDVISIGIAKDGGHKIIQPLRISYKLFMKMKKKEYSKLGEV